MPRPIKRNKLPKTSISISVELWEILTRNKPRHDTMDEFLGQVVEGYSYYKENYEFLKQVYEETSNKNSEYVRRIKELEFELQLGNQKVEPARGVAAESCCPQISSSPIPGDNMATNLPPEKKIEEVTEKV